MLIYDPHNSYWKLSNRPDVVFSSAKPGYISLSDGTYEEWLANGNVVAGSANMTDGQLANVLRQAGVNGAAILACEPQDWTGVSSNDVVAAVIAAGVALTSTGTSSLDALYETSGQSFADLQNLLLYTVAFNAFPLGKSEVAWPARDKIITFASIDQLKQVAKGLSDYLSQWRDWLASGGAMPKFGAIQIP